MEQRKNMHRDVAVGQQVSELKNDSNYFNTIFEYFGCLYLKKGDFHTAISSSGEDIFSLIYDGLLENKFAFDCLHQVKSIDRLTEKNGLKEFLETEYKKYIEQLYSNPFLAIIRSLNHIPFSDQARFYLENYFNTISTDHNLKRETYLWAIRARICSPIHYNNDWDKSKIKTNDLQRTLYGCAYHKRNGKWEYLFNANKIAFFQLYQNLYEKALVVSPYWYNNYSLKQGQAPKQLKEVFQEDLKNIFTEDYLLLIDILSNLYNTAAKDIFLNIRTQYSQCNLYEQNLLKKIALEMHIDPRLFI